MCAKDKKYIKTREDYEQDFIQKLNLKFNNKFKLDKLHYLNGRTPITLICPHHGDFITTGTNVLGSEFGYPECAKQLKGKTIPPKDLSSFSKLTTEQFIEKAKQVEKLKRPDGTCKTDFSLVNYINAKSNVTFICLDHDLQYEQRANGYLNGKNGCPECIAGNKHNTFKFIKKLTEESKQRFGDKISLEKVKYITAKLPVIFICKEHGEFEKTPEKFLESTYGCQKCYEVSDKTVEVDRNKYFLLFQEKSNIKFNSKFDFSESIYINGDTDCIFKCPNHGYVTQKPSKHLESKYGCHQCYLDLLKENKKPVPAKFDPLADLKRRSKNFIFNAQETHKKEDGTPTYKYHKVNFINRDNKVIVVCDDHGDFLKYPFQHINEKEGCPKCAAEERIKETGIKFIKTSKELHGDKLRYEKFIYNGYPNMSIFICNRCGIEINQTPNANLNCLEPCPTCFSKNKNQSEIKLLNKIKEAFPHLDIVSQGRPKWLLNKKGQQYQSLDIYFPDYNIAIEYQGEQHFKPVDKFGGEGHLKVTQERDEHKNKLCLDNNCKLLYFNYFTKLIPNNYPYKIIMDEEQLINMIKEELEKRKT